MTKLIKQYLTRAEASLIERYIAWAESFGRNEAWVKDTFTFEGETAEVEGDLYLLGTPITSLPEGLKVGGWLDLRGTPITSLPEGLKVDGFICLDTNQTTLIKQAKERGLKIEII